MLSITNVCVCRRFKNPLGAGQNIYLNPSNLYSDSELFIRSWKVSFVLYFAAVRWLSASTHYRSHRYAGMVRCSLSRSLSLDGTICQSISHQCRCFRMSTLQWHQGRLLKRHGGKAATQVCSHETRAIGLEMGSLQPSKYFRGR